MMKTFGSLFPVFGAVILLLAAGCASPRSARFSRSYDLNREGIRIGAFGNCDSERFARLIFNKAKIITFDDAERGCISLLTERIDGFVYDEHVLRLVSWRYPDRFKMLEPALDTEPSSVAVAKTRPDVLKQINAFIAESRTNGIYDDMFLRWFHDPERVWDGVPDMPTFPPAPAGAPVLRVGTDCDEAPSAYLGDNGEMLGFDIEFIYRFAARYGYRVELVLKPFTELLADVAAGRLDCAVANLDHNEANKDVLWSDGYVSCDVVMLVKVPDSGAAEK